MSEARYEKSADGIEPEYEVAVIGAGPIGIELAVCLKRAGICYIHFDAHQIGHTMTWWPRNTSFFSTTERLAIAGVPIQNSHQQRITGEDYLSYLRGIVEQFDLRIRTYERVVDLKCEPDGFGVITQALAGSGPFHFRCRRVVVAIGDMHCPSLLNIPGEQLPHVSHYFRDPHDYFRRRLLIVGGKNSAVEAALRCWRAGAEVALSYRRAAFDQRQVKHWLLPDLLSQIRAGSIRFLASTVPVAITPSFAELAQTDEQGCPVPGGTLTRWPVDFVLLATGFRADQSLLEKAGVELCGENRVPFYDPKTMETNIRGLHVAGTTTAGIQHRYGTFIENSHEHVGKIAAAITGRWPDHLGTISSRNCYHTPDHLEGN